MTFLRKFSSGSARERGADLQESVIDNLTALLNSRSLEGVADLRRFPHARRSVINFGVSELRRRGALASNEMRDVARAVANAVGTFEPRILRGTLNVRPVVNEQGSGRGTISLELSGFLASPGDGQLLRLRITMDTNGWVRVTDHSSRQANR